MTLKQRLSKDHDMNHHTKIWQEDLCFDNMISHHIQVRYFLHMNTQDFLSFISYDTTNLKT